MIAAELKKDFGFKLPNRPIFCYWRPPAVRSRRHGRTLVLLVSRSPSHRCVTLQLQIRVVCHHQIFIYFFYRENKPFFSANVDCINEWMQLEKAGLLEFTTGDMFQRLAMGARKTDGCVVSRNQMHDIIKRWPQFKDTIESRFVMLSSRSKAGNG
jgi:hypothetical protein